MKRDKRTEITAAEIRKAFRLPHNSRLTLHAGDGRAPAMPIEKISIGTIVPVPLIESDPTYIPG